MDKRGGSVKPIQGEVYLLENKEAEGNMVKKQRPCVVISPDALNKNLGTVMVIPLTSNTEYRPYRVRTKFRDKDGMAMCEQIATFSSDSELFKKPAGTITKEELKKILEMIRKIFSP